MEKEADEEQDSLTEQHLAAKKELKDLITVAKFDLDKVLSEKIIWDKSSSHVSFFCKALKFNWNIL